MKSLSGVQPPVTLRTVVLLAAFAVSLLPATGHTQTVQELMKLGDKETAARQGDPALKAYEDALKADSMNSEALLKAVTTAVALAEFGTSTRPQGQLVNLAERYARRMYEKDSTKAEAQYALAQALGRAALYGGQLSRLKYVAAIKGHSQRCLVIQPKHPGCLHILGNWYAEVMRLNGFQKQMAISMTKASLFEDATWENAVKNLETAVAVNPKRIIHHVVLGQIYADMGQKEKARTEFKFVASAPLTDFNDDKYKELAATGLKKLDETPAR